jgi:hypothetical protein
MSHRPRSTRDRLGEVRRILCSGETDDSDRNCLDFVRRHSGQRPHLKFLQNLWPPFHPTLLTASRPCRDSAAAGQRILPLHAIPWRSNRMITNHIITSSWAAEELQILCSLLRTSRRLIPCRINYEQITTIAPSVTSCHHAVSGGRPSCIPRIQHTGR